MESRVITSNAIKHAAKRLRRRKRKTIKVGDRQKRSERKEGEEGRVSMEREQLIEKRDGIRNGSVRVAGGSTACYRRQPSC